MFDALVWYLALQASALATWPLAARALAPLHDRGWVAAKVGGLLLVAWAAWFTSMLSPLPYTRLTLWAVVLLVAGVAWLWLERRWPTGAVAWPRQSWRGLLASEAVLMLTFGLFALLRAREPAIAGTEKPMDMAFLNGFITAQRLPTQDTWLAGYGVPYYYFGFVVFASLAKLAGTAPGVAYNLAAATVPALAAAGLGSLAWNAACGAGLGRRAALLAGGLAPLLVVFAGNLSAFFELLVALGVLRPDAGTTLGIKAFSDGVQPGVWPPGGAWWWRASRVVPNTRPDGINEFPFFSAFLSDLHPHFVALPFEVLALSLVAVHLLSRGASLRSWWTQAAAGLTLGGLLAANTWDVAPFWLLYLGGAFAAGAGLPLRERAWRTVLAPLLGVALFVPYFIGYGGPPLGVGLVDDQTPLGSLLVLFGPQLALLALFGVWTRVRAADRRGWAVVAGGGLLGGLVAAAGQPGIGLLVLVVALLTPWPGVFDGPRLPLAYAQGLGWFAACVLLGTELVFLRDSFGTRMNTVFKFHYNAWLLSGLAGALGVATVVAADRRVVRWAAAGLAAAVLLAGLVYPLSAIRTRLNATPPGGPTLDGTAFLAPDDAAGVAWLREQTRATGARPVVAEAVTGSYASGTRMATYSGAVALIGWPGHELQWRGPLPELGQRENDVRALYQTADVTGVRGLLQRYGVQYVVVGDLERERYGATVDSRFRDVLPVAFRSGRLTIYRAA